MKLIKNVQTLDNDALRAKTNEFKARIAEHIEDEAKQIEALRAEIEANPDLEADAKEKIYLQIDKLEKLQYDKTEEKLTELLPEAFSVVREVARRFKENTEIEVTATEMDRNFASTREHVSIQGNKAIYKNSWLAGGNTITWDMVHYDVQLIGGIVLHQARLPRWPQVRVKPL